MIKRSNWFKWIIFFGLSSSAWCAITTHIEPTTLSLTDSFQLTFTLDNPSFVGQPDFSPLQHDFIIHATEHSMSSSIINGHVRTSNQWLITLSPQHTGKLTIPSIQIGGEHSSLSEINVTDQPQATLSSNSSTPLQPMSNQHVQLKTHVDEHQPYIHQQIRYTVKLYHQEQLLNADYQPPQLEDALIIPLGDSQAYQSTQQGQTYVVEEQQYALFPQKTGPQSLQGPSFQALIFDGMPQHVRTKAKSIQLQVKSIPLSFTAKKWLPTPAASLTERYLSSKTTFTEGSTITRTITLRAKDLPAELLPTLKAKPLEQFSVYPEKPTLNNQINDHHLIGEERLKINYVLNQPGVIHLPAYSITWFNTLTGKQDMASLPERTIHVIHQEITPSKQSSNTSTSSTDTVFNSPSSHNILPWILTLIFATAWLITIFLFFIRKRAAALLNPPSSPTKSNTKPRKTASALYNTPHQAQASILAWAKTRWPHVPFSHLSDIIHHLHDGELKQQLRALQERLYSTKHQEPWDGAALQQALKTYRHPTAKKTTKPVLSPINPSQR